MAMMYDMVDIPKKTELFTYFPPSCFPLMREIIFSIFLSKAGLFLFDVAATYNFVFPLSSTILTHSFLWLIKKAIKSPIVIAKLARYMIHTPGSFLTWRTVYCTPHRRSEEHTSE